MLQARGYYRTTGTGSAWENLKRQVPEIFLGFPEITDYYQATINVRFEPQIIVSGWDYRTPPIRWTGGEHGEVFDILRVWLTFNELSVRAQALMYVAHWSPHRKDPHKHEFLAKKFIAGLRENMSVLMECDHRHIELPYTDSDRGTSGKPRLARTLAIL